MLTEMKMSLEKIASFYLCHFANISTHSTCIKSGKLPRNQIGRHGISVEKENEKFTVVCSRSPQSLEFGHLRCCFAENSKKYMYQNIKCMRKAIFFLMKPIVALSLLLPLSLSLVKFPVVSYPMQY